MKAPSMNRFGVHIIMRQGTQHPYRERIQLRRT